MRKCKIIAPVLALALVITSISVPAGSADAAKKPKLSKSKTSVAVGSTVKLKVKNGSKKAKVTWKSAKKAIATVKKVKKAKTPTATVKGIVAGKTKITATYKLKGKTTKLKCTVTVTEDKKDAATTSTSPSPNPGTGAGTVTGTPTPADNPSAQPTGGAGNVTQAPDDTEAPTTKPTSTPTKKPTPTKAPTPTPTPYTINGYTVDLSTVDVMVDGMPGTEAGYDSETGCIESAMVGQSGFIIHSPITEQKDEYKYVEITYNLASTGDVNIYAGKYDATAGQEGTGWSPEIKLNNYPMDEEYTILLSSKDSLENEPLGAVKFINFGPDTTISISNITFFMDGDVSTPEDYISRTLKDEEITVDGVAAAEEGWSEAKLYRFNSKISETGSVENTDTRATVRFMNDANNLYFFVDVKDSSIDKASSDYFKRDGLEILFDEDNCRKTGSGSTDWTENPDGMHHRFTGLDKDSAEKTGLVGETDMNVSGGKDGKTIETEIKYALTDKGYSIEGRIPFAAEKAIGDKISLDLIVQDCKGGSRQNELYLYPTKEAKGYWNNESADFGTVILDRAESAEPGPDQPDPNQPDTDQPDPDQPAPEA